MKTSLALGPTLDYMVALSQKVAVTPHLGFPHVASVLGPKAEVPRELISSPEELVPTRMSFETEFNAVARAHIEGAVKRPKFRPH